MIHCSRLSGRSAVAQRSLCLQRKRLSLHYTKIGDAGCIRLHVNQPLQRRCRGLWTSLALLVGRGPRTLDRRDDEQRGSPYDAKCNVAEIGVINMGEIGAVRKRSR